MGKSTPTSREKVSAKDAALLARAKTEINLPGWFTSLGWVADPEHDSRRNRVMRGPDGARVVIARQPDGHWTFFDAADNRRSGTIFDAAKHFGGAVTPGQQYAALRRALVSPPPPVPVIYAAGSSTTGSIARTPARVLPLDAEGTAYLTDRHLSTATIEAFSHALFTVQGRGVQAKHNQRGGEERGADHRHFSGGNADQPGQGRSLWMAVPLPGEQPERIILAESFIDALSAWQLLPTEQRLRTAVGSTGGSICRASLDKLARALQRVPGVQVLDASDQGEATTDRRIEQVRAATESAGASYSRLEPPPGCKDWNDAVRAAAVAQAAALMPAVTEDDEQVLTL